MRRPRGGQVLPQGVGNPNDPGRTAMMLVPTTVRPSAIHGLGLFATAPIPAGTPVWRFEPGFDRTFPDSVVASLPALAQAHLHWFAYRNPGDGSWALSGDHTCFMNHSERPNTGAPTDATPPITTVALRDIAAGEELTCDYRAFDAEADAKLGLALPPPENGKSATPSGHPG